MTADGHGEHPGDDYRELLEGLVDVVYEIDADGKVLYVSPAIERRLGFTAAEVVGRSFRSLFSQEDRDRATEAFAELRRGEIGPREYRLRHRDGHFVWVRTSSRPRFEGERFLGIRGVLTDISDLRESHDRVRFLAHAVRSIGEGVCVTDADDVIRFVNEPFARIFGYQPKELVGQSIGILRPAEFPEPLAAEIGARTAAAGFHGDVPNVRKDGSEVLVSLSTSLVTDEDGAVIGQVGVVRDVTEQRRSEAARRASETRYRALFEASSDGVMLLEGARFLEVNGAAAAMFGVAREELIGKSPWDVSPELQPDGRSSREKTQELVTAALAGEPQRFRWQHQRADGSTLHAEVGLSRVEIGGLALVQALVRDVTGAVQAREVENKRLRQLTAVSRVARKIAATLDAKVVQEAAVEEVRRAFDFHNVSLLLLDAEAGVLGRQVMAGAYAASAADDYVQRLGEGLIGVAAATGETVLANDVARDSRYLEGFGWEKATRSELAVPVKLADRVLGVLDVQETRVDAFDEVDVQTLETLADQIALTLHNAGLYQRLETELDERRRAQAALRDSEERYRDLVETASDLICTHDLEGRILSANQTAGRRLGYDTDQLVGLNLRDFLSPDVRGTFAAYLEQIAQEGSAHGLMKLMARDGELRYWEYSNTLRTEGVPAPVVRGFARDVTDRVRAERALRESEERFRLLYENSPAPYQSLGEDGRILEVNPAWLNLLGYERDEVIGRWFGEFLAPHEVDAFRERFPRFKEIGSTVVTFELVRRDGATVVASIRGKVGCDPDGVFVKTHCVLDDITERRRTELALRESEERYRLLAETAHDMILLVSPDGTIGYCNQRAIDLSGYGRDEVATLRVDQVIAPEYLAGWRERWGRRLSGADEQFLYEVEFVTRDGRRVPVEVSSQPILQDGRLTGILVVARDITERYRAEEAVRAERDRVRQYLDIAPVLFVALDQDGRVTLVNQRTCEVLGRREEEIVGRDWFGEFVPATVRGGIRTSFAQLMAGDLEPFESWENPILTASGEERLVAWRNSLLRDGRGAVIGSLSAGEDVTERKQLEEQLRHAQKMEAMGRLAGGVAHDFNNLLQAMLATVQLLRLGGADEPSISETAEELEAHVQRGASLARQLLLFAKRGVTQPERLDLEELITGAVALLRRLVRENVDVSAVTCGRPLPVDGDRGQLEQVLTNLALNAVDAMPAGGRLTLRTGAGEDGDVWLEVSDTGHGMTEEVLGKIFEPFFTTKEAGKGTGLGLAVVHGIVAQHQGRIEVSSAPDRGSTFRIVLPRYDSGVFSVVREPRSQPGEPVHGGGERIVLVEDNEQIRVVFSRMLARLGYEVVAVATGEEAGLLPPEPPFDLLISDVMLPGISGVDAARGLLERWPALKVILMSGYAEDDVLREEILSGNVHFLQKPIDLATLAQHVRAALGG